MSELEVVARFADIHPDKLEEFTQLAAELIERTRREPGTLRYDWFMSDDRRSCVLLERYADSGAVLAHAVNLGDDLARIAELGGGLEISGFGDPDPELTEMITSVGASVYRPFSP